MSEKVKLCVLASGRGTDLQSIIDACESGGIRSARVAMVLSNVPEAYALERAKDHGIEAVCVPSRGMAREHHEEAVAREVNARGIGLIVLAGYVRILSPHFFKACSIPVINIHPALLPLFGGKGWYGDKVHEAVIASGARYSGCSVHIVTPDVDAGPIIVQKVVPVYPDDTHATLAQKVLEKEHKLLPLAVELMASGRARLKDGKVCIDGYAELEKEISAL
jgi:phosphoribosylglycinamide formyltransferase-1